VVVTTLNSSSVDFLLRFHVHDASLSVPLRFEYTEKIRKALGRAGIEIPFPHLQLFVDGVQGLQGLRMEGGEIQLDVS
jgi:small conductance mechanosensitive channel